MPVKAPQPPPLKPWLTRYRGTVLFCSGLAGLAAETVGSIGFGRTPDPSLLIIFGGMMGLPAFLPKDKGGDGE